MSHVAEVNLKIFDLEALAQASRNVGLEFKAGQTSYRWYGNWQNDYHAADAAARRGHDPRLFGKSEHAIVVPNNDRAYGIGVVPALDGVGYSMVYDNWQGGYGLEGVAGRGLERLKQEYAAEVSVRRLTADGYAITRHVDELGQIVIQGVSR